MTTAIKTVIGFAAVFVCVGLVGLVVWIIGLRRAAVAIGKPTPEEARVKVEAATKPVIEKATADVKGIENASKDDLERLAHDLARRK